MPKAQHSPIEVAMVAVPETTGSVLYGMIDLLSAAGTLWNELVDAAPPKPLFRTRVVGLCREAFRCANGVPVVPDCGIEEARSPAIVIVPELWRRPQTTLSDAYPGLSAWLRDRDAGGSFIYSSCTGSILLAASGLLDGRTATSHWAYEDLFGSRFGKVDFLSGPSLVAAEPSGRIVTASGSTSWQDLALHVVARHGGPEEALRVAKVNLLRWHEEGQRPYAALVRRQAHDDAIVAAVERWLDRHFAQANVLGGAVDFAGLAERTLKRRFRRATGSSLIERIQGLRIEDAKRRLEMSPDPIDAISLAVGYENTSFFSRLFKRLTATTPGNYRRMFRPIARSGNLPSPASSR